MEQTITGNAMAKAMNVSSKRAQELTLLGLTIQAPGDDVEKVKQNMRDTIAGMTEEEAFITGIASGTLNGLSMAREQPMMASLIYTKMMLERKKAFEEMMK